MKSTPIPNATSSIAVRPPIVQHHTLNRNEYLVVNGNIASIQTLPTAPKYQVLKSDKKEQIYW